MHVMHYHGISQNNGTCCFSIKQNILPQQAYSSTLQHSRAAVARAAEAVQYRLVAAAAVTVVGTRKPFGLYNIAGRQPSFKPYHIRLNPTDQIRILHQIR